MLVLCSTPLLIDENLQLRIDCSVSFYADDMLLQQLVATTEDAVEFQNNINAVHKWSVKLKMPFRYFGCVTEAIQSLASEAEIINRHTS